MHILFLGDYIDRGSGWEFEYFSHKFGKMINLYCEDIGSRLIVERLMKLKEYFVDKNISHTFLRGNHEHYFIENIKSSKAAVCRTFEVKRSTLIDTLNRNKLDNVKQ